MDLTQSRQVKLFKNGRNQAVRIPREFELPGSDAVMYREGNRLIVEAVEPRTLKKMLANWHSIDDGLPTIADKAPRPVKL